MAHHSSNPYRADSNATNAIDRKREKERRYMLQMTYKNATELAQKLVQRLLDRNIIEITSERAIRELFEDLLKKIPEMEEFDINFKIAPLRTLVPNPNFLSLYLTQYIIEDLINHSKIQDIFGDDEEVYNAVDSIMSQVKPQSS